MEKNIDSIHFSYATSRCGRLWQHDLEMLYRATKIVATNGIERAATFEQCMETRTMLPHKNLLYQMVEIKDLKIHLAINENKEYTSYSKLFNFLNIHCIDP